MRTNVQHNNEVIKFRIITYKIGDNDYFLGTTIMNHRVEYFKDIYWKRWNIETNFRESKYLLSLNNINSKSENKVKQDIYSHSILFLIHSYLKNQFQQFLPDNKFINSANLMYLLVNEIIYLFFYKKMTYEVKKNLIKYVNVLIKD